MKILVIGSGGREHALVWKIAQSPLVTQVVAAPGNAGMAASARCVNLAADDPVGLTRYARNAGFDLVVIGPEIPLSLGLSDMLNEAGITVFGPGERAAQLESSKRYAKNFCIRYGIPTASFDECRHANSAIQAAKKRCWKCVLKADGLAAGKGVFVCRSRPDVDLAVGKLFHSHDFGDAASFVIVEDLLEGEEASILAVADGESYIILESSQDHKAAFDNDEGPNTGGMGAYSPAPVISKSLLTAIDTTILRPAIDGMKKDGNPFSGVLYAGLMITGSGPHVLEFNVRFGDPETQPLMCRLQSDLVELLLAGATGKLHVISPPKWSPFPAVCVVMASGGYPGKYGKGYPVTGLEKVSRLPDTMVFHAGTACNENGEFVTAGGRVLGVTATGPSIGEACQAAYSAVKCIHFENVFFRKDIAHRALNRGNM